MDIDLAVFSEVLHPVSKSEADIRILTLERTLTTSFCLHIARKDADIGSEFVGDGQWRIDLESLCGIIKARGRSIHGPARHFS